MSKKCSRVQRTPFSTRTTRTKEKRRKRQINLSPYFGNFRGLLGDPRRVPILMTATPLLVQCQGTGDFRCLQQADKWWNPKTWASSDILSRGIRASCDLVRSFFRWRHRHKITVKAWGTDTQKFGKGEILIGPPRMILWKNCQNSPLLWFSN